MKILFITPTMPSNPTKDGMSLIAYYLLKHLSPNHQITTLATDQYLHLRKPSLFKHYASLRYRRQPWYIERHTSPTLVKMIREEEKHFDLIYLHSPFSLGYLPYINHTPVVAGLIDLMSGWYEQLHRNEQRCTKRLHLKQERKASLQLERNLIGFPLLKRIIVVSKEDEHQLACLRAEMVQVIPNGVDIELFKPDPTIKKERAIIFTGVMNYPPNVDAVLYCFEKFWPTLRELNLRWYIVGKNPTLEIQALAEKDKQILVTGLVGDMLPFLNEALVYVAPSRIGTGMKNKILEAMACGLPVVALPTADGGLTDAPLVIANETDFVSQVQLLIDDEVKRNALGTQGRNYVEQQHNWVKIAKQYEQVFFTVTNQKY